MAEGQQILTNSLIGDHVLYITLKGCNSGQAFRVEIVRHFEGLPMPAYQDVM